MLNNSKLFFIFISKSGKIISFLQDKHQSENMNHNTFQNFWKKTLSIN